MSGQITSKNYNKIKVSAIPPSSPATDQLWLDCSILPYQLKVWVEGADWNDSIPWSDNKTLWDDGAWWNVSDTRIDDRNLIFNGIFASDTKGWSLGILDSSTKYLEYNSIKLTRTQIFTQSVASKLKPDTTYTISCFAKYDSVVGTGEFGLFAEGSGLGAYSYMPAGTSDWKKYTRTFTTLKTLTALNVGWYYRHSYTAGTAWATAFRLEEGTVAHDWTPAQEDVDLEIANAIAKADSMIALTKIDNLTDTLFHFDKDLNSTSSIKPLDGHVATLRPGEGKFGGCVAIEEGTTNLIINGDFSDGLSGWGVGGDAVVQTLIVTPYGKGVRVSRGDGSGGDWPLCLNQTCPVVTIGDVWTFSFKFKVVKGDAQPFNFGVWTDDAGYNPYSLQGNIIDLGNGWKQYTATYTWKANHQKGFQGAWGFNSNADYSIVEITNVQLEEKPFATSFVNGTRAVGKLLYPESVFNPDEGSFCCWAKTPIPATNSDRNIFFQWDTTGSTQGHFGLVLLGNGRITFWFSTGIINSKDTFNDGNWHQYAITWKNGTNQVCLYVDGILQGSALQSLTITNLGGRKNGVIPLGIRGWEYYNDPWNGLIDEVLWRKKAMSEQDIQYIYNAQQPFHDDKNYITATGQYSIYDYNDALTLSGYISTNHPKTQMYNQDNNSYNPNWATTNLVLTPSLFKLGSGEDIISSLEVTNVTWSSVNNGLETVIAPDTYHTFTGAKAHILTIKSNDLTNIPSLELVCNITYLDFTTKLVLNHKINITLNKTMNGSGTAGAICWAPQGNIFKNATNTTLTAQCDLWRNGVIDTTSVEYRWFKSDSSVSVGHANYDVDAGIGWYLIKTDMAYNITGVATNTVTIYSSYVDASEIFMCLIKDTEDKSGTSNTIFKDTVSFIDQTDSYQLSILSTGGDVFKNGVGTTTLTAVLFQGDTEIDRDGVNFTYTWTMYDRENKQSAFVGGEYVRKGKSINVGQEDVYIKATFNVDVS